ISLLQRLDDVGNGAILIDGRDIRSVSQDSLRRQIAVVPQEPALFNRTVLENIGYGLPDASEEQIVAALHEVNCDEVIHSLLRGYGTKMAEYGVMFAAGHQACILLS
ncbi:ATP-binding cassette domain-containing protein, partial [Pseudomonas viridiflava]|uniref:ATP-binding cassette domain-containing protein n=1 Tax=Pseudomonas viridiflava TaxID=33069 RepID=UPI0013CEA406